MTSRHRPTPAAALAAALFVVLAVCLPGAAGAATAGRTARAGTWSGYPYLSGVVCQDGDQTEPLASWDLGDGQAPAFVLAPVTATSAGAQSVPPLAQVGPQAATPVEPGEFGFTDQTEIAGYASLLTRFGSADAGTVAALADAVLRVNQPSTALPGCDDQALAASLAQDAPSLAGPYTLSLDPPATPAEPGQGAQVTATVTSTSGNPVPGATVTLDASLPLFGGSSTTTVRTGGDGTAVATLDVPADTTADSIAVGASAPVATTLTAVTATAAAGGPRVVPAIVASDVSTATATTSVPIDRTPDPRASLSVSVQAVVVGASTTPTLTVDGLRGHAAQVALSIAGPLPLTSATLCAARTPADFVHAPAAYSAQGPIPAGSSEAGGADAHAAAPFVPTRPGCYRLTATVVTTDATPQADTSAALSTPLTVLDTSVRAAVAHQVVGAHGTDTVTVTASPVYGAGAVFQGTVTTPVRPSPTKGCAGVAYGGASTTPLAGRALTAAAAGALRASVPVTSAGVGCYRVAGRVVVTGRPALTGAPAVSVSVPIDATHAPTVLAIDPAVTIVPVRPWGTVHEPVSVSAALSGTYGQPAHVRLAMQRHDTSATGCDARPAGEPAVTANGPATAVSGDYVPTTVDSAAIGATGCYVPVVTLTMDANPTLRTTSTGTIADAIEVGIDPDAPAGDLRRQASHGGDDSDGVPAWSIVGAAALVMLAVVAVLVLARDDEEPA